MMRYDSPRAVASRHRRTAFTALALVLASGLFAACRPSPRPEPFEPVYNVILISIDTLRADHLGTYGYGAPTSPAIDAFAEESVVFEQTIAHAPSTLHSHASMLSSLLPQQHRASWGAKTRLAEETLTLPEILGANGYQTAAWTGGGQMAAEFGLSQGFDTYSEPGKQFFRGTVELATQWMDANGDRPFFLFLHNYEVHHPYEPAAEHRELLGIDYQGDLGNVIDKDLLEAVNKKEREASEEDLQHIVDLYDAEIRSMDQGFEALIAYLREKGLYDSTMILFTSDHGEEFGEHGRMGWHSHALWDELLKVPFIVRYPGGEHGGTRVERQVRGIDLAPTVIGFLGLPMPEEFCGADLDPLVRGEELSPLDAVSRIDRKRQIERSSIRTESWKLLGRPDSRALFNLEEDPEELWDRALKDTEVRERLRARLDELVGECPALDPPVVMPTDKTLEELKKLGYLN